MPAHPRPIPYRFVLDQEWFAQMNKSATSAGRDWRTTIPRFRIVTAPTTPAKTMNVSKSHWAVYASRTPGAKVTQSRASAQEAVVDPHVDADPGRLAGRLLAQVREFPAQRRIPLGRLQHHEPEVKQGDDDDRRECEDTQHVDSPCRLR